MAKTSAPCWTCGTDIPRTGMAGPIPHYCSQNCLPLCTVEGCDKRTSRSRGLCPMHYQRWRVHGDPALGVAPARAACSVEDCDRLRVAQGVCERHYQRWRKYGDPLGAHRWPTPVERMWAQLVVGGEDECWEWSGGLSDGYGYFRVGNRKTYIHRLAWETLRGPIPEGLHIDHLCRNTRCANPAHLEPVTAAENSRRAHRHARWADACALNG